MSSSSVSSQFHMFLKHLTYFLSSSDTMNQAKRNVIYFIVQLIISMRET